MKKLGEVELAQWLAMRVMHDKVIGFTPSIDKIFFDYFDFIFPKRI